MTMLWIAMMVVTPSSVSLAQGAPEPRIVHAIDRYPYILWRESWGGGELQARSWSLYSGTTVALTGDIEADGWRLRSTAGYGQYSYRKWIRGQDRPEHAKLTGRKVFSDVLLGHQLHWSRLTVKTFAGLTSERHIIDPRDADSDADGFAYGGKAALEAWLSVTDRHWLAGSASWASTHKSFKLELKTGYNVRKSLDIGIEARLDGDETYSAGRVGAFATWRVGDAGVTATAGYTGDREMRTSPYASLSLFYRY
jgi:hypothetical protein